MTWALSCQSWISASNTECPFTHHTYHIREYRTTMSAAADVTSQNRNPDMSFICVGTLGREYIREPVCSAAHSLEVQQHMKAP
jgi:hypothetical protein